MAANNVLAHVPDINDFVAGFARLLKPAGVATFEFPHLLRMVQHNQFDTAYHEHYSYLSLTSVRTVFEANGLAVFDVEELSTHGGSLRVYAQRRDYARRASHRCASPRCSLRSMPRAWTRLGSTRASRRAPKESRTSSLPSCSTPRAQGLRVGAYGAAAKGNTLLNFAGVRPDLLPYVADLNPAKQGRFMPGSRVPIVAEERLRQHQPSRIVILPWNLKDEVMQQLEYARAWGARFVTAVPRLEVT